MTLYVSDHSIPTSQGSLFARRWLPQGAPGPGRAPIVLLHESLGCVTLWRNFPEQLARATGRMVVAYDRLGFGLSSPHPGRLRPDFIGAEANGGFRAVREALDIGLFVVFGHSVGGGMAVGCAAGQPDCLGVVTEGAQAFVEDRTLAGVAEAKALFAQPGQRERLQKHHGDKTDWVLAAWIDTWLAPGFADWTLDASLARVACPLLALHGERDEYGTRAHPERIVAGAGGAAELHLLPACGHVPHRQQAALVLGRVAAWLDDIG